MLSFVIFYCYHGAGVQIEITRVHLRSRYGILKDIMRLNVKAPYAIFLYLYINLNLEVLCPLKNQKKKGGGGGRIKKKGKKIGVGASLPALSVATLVWEAEEWETNPSLGGRPSVGGKSGGGGGGGGRRPPFFR